MELLRPGDPALLQPAQAVETDIDWTPMVRDLREFLIMHGGAVGLAAPQVGVPLRIIVLEHKDLPGWMVNPRITWSSDGYSRGWERCLSVRGAHRIARANAVTVAWWDPETRSTNEQAFHGFAARILQHEIDHLEGRLIG